MAVIEKMQITVEVYHRGALPDFANMGSLM